MYLFTAQIYVNHYTQIFYIKRASVQSSEWTREKRLVKKKGVQTGKTFRMYKGLT